MNNLNKEDGYILIVVVGIMMVFSLMAITFATLTRVETKAARNYTDSVKCEAVAKAGLEHAIYELRLDKFGTDTLAYNDNDNNNYGLDENFDASGTSWPGNAIFPYVDDGYDNDGINGEDSQWIYIPGTDTATSAIRLPGSLRARYAVLITDDREARININATGNTADGGNAHASNEGWSTFEIDLSDLIEQQIPGRGNIAAKKIIATGLYPRHGPDSKPGDEIVNDDSAKIPPPESDEIDNNGDSGADEPGEEIDEPNEFNPIFPIGDDMPFDILTEVEIMGTTTYTSKLEEMFDIESFTSEEQAELKGYLTTYSADTILCPPYQLNDGTSTTRLNINALVNNEGAYAGATSDEKVEMLIDVLTAGGVPDVQRQQMAVNIKDFIDPDSTVTIYNDGTDDYYGVDKTPYINEVEANPGAMEFIELYNPYDETIEIGGWTITGTTMGTVTITGGAQILAGDYYVIANVLGEDQHEATMDLVDDGETLTLTTDPGSGSTTVQVTFYGNASGNANNTRSLNDPRPIPLTATPSDPWSWATTGNSMDLPNDNLPSVGGDGWDGGTYSSSFLIANRRFSNKGYLGFIHNGEEWTSFDVRDTINPDYIDVLQYITITDPSMDGIDNDGDGDIDSVDTGLQVGDIDGQEYRIPGLINVNTASAEVLASLPDGSGDPLGNTIANEIETSVGKPFESIGDLVAKVSDITGAGTKWEEEETFRAISNLITTRSNVFTVYVTAQVTNDAGSVFAEKRIMAIVDRSVNPIKVRYFRWITE